MIKSFDLVNEYLSNNALPSHDLIFDLTEAVSTILDNEKTSYRPVNDLGEAGSILDFQGNLKPLIVVPDLHARPEFILNIMNYKLPEEFLGKRSCSVFQALEKDLVRLVCVGDALHTERNTKSRWDAAQREFDSELFTGPAMTQEMKEGLALLCGIFKLKDLFPSNVHFLKGNHENILNRQGFGDYGFRKFADEGQMCKEFIIDYYGEDILYLIHYIEDSLPLVCVTDNCVISHAEPRKAYSKQELLNARSFPEVVAGLTWTDNGEVTEDTALGIIKNLSSKSVVTDYVYLAGHRPVSGTYRERQNGIFIQIHNPALQNIALVPPERKFDPQTDIVSVIK